MRKSNIKRESQQEYLLLHKRFNDFDDFSDMVKTWDLDFYQLDRGKFRAELLQVITNALQIGHARFNRNLDQRGSPPPGLWTFALLTERSSPILWRGREVSNNTILIYHPGSEIDAVSRQGFDVITLSFSEKSLNNAARMLGLPDISELVGEADSRPVDFLKMRELRNVLLGFIHEVKENPLVLTQNAHTVDPMNELAYCILECLTSRCGMNKESSYRKRDHALKQIRDYIRDHIKVYPDIPLSVQDLSRMAGISIRTLEYVFLERFGVPPQKYLKARWLNAVKRELCTADVTSTKISDVANYWGFWHIGQFSADYRWLFGELPSETLARRRAVIDRTTETL